MRGVLPVLVSLTGSSACSWCVPISARVLKEGRGFSPFADGSVFSSAFRVAVCELCVWIVGSVSSPHISAGAACVLSDKSEGLVVLFCVW